MTNLVWHKARRKSDCPSYETASLYGVKLDVAADFRYREVGNNSYYIDRVYGANFNSKQMFDRVEIDGTRRRYNTLWDAFNKVNGSEVLV